MNKKEERKGKILELYNAGIKIVEISERLDVAVSTVSRYIKELKDEGKIQNRRKNSKKEENKEKTLELYNLGMQGKEISERLKLSNSTISVYIKELKEEGRIQEAKKNKIKKENKQKVLELYNSGLQRIEISERLKLSNSTVDRYIKELKEEGRIEKTRKNRNKEKVLELYNFGLQGIEIAERMNLSSASISVYIRKLKEEGRIEEGRKNRNKEKVLELYNTDINKEEMAERLDVAVSTVNRYIRELKEEGRIEKTRKNRNKEKVLELYNFGLQGIEIAERMNLSSASISVYIRKLKEEGKIQKRRKLQKRRKNPQKEENKEKTLELYNLGMQGKEIAESLGLSAATVGRYIKELKEEGKIQKNVISQKNISMSVQKIVNKEKFTKNDYKKFSEYISNCKERLSNGNLKKEDLIIIKKVADMTYKYDYIVFYIKACIHLGQTTEAKKVVNSVRFSEDFSVEQKEKLNELSKKIVEVGKKRRAIIMLKEGRSIKETAEYSGLRETEVAQLNRKLLAKNRKAQPGDAIGEGR